MQGQKAKLLKLAGDYFRFTACAYPVMSLSDEFYFFPRPSQAIQYMNNLDSLDEEKIKQDISYIKALKLSLERLDIKDMDLETQIDWHLLKQSIAGFLREFQQVKIWRNDPNLYLKDIHEELASRIKQIPRLVNEAKLNLGIIPIFYKQTALQMAKVQIDYLKGIKIIGLRVLIRKTIE